MASLPTGTVTFLFSDIEGSTRLLDDLGTERYSAGLEAHRRLLRAAFTRHAGVEIGTEGDSFFVAFHRAQDAVRAAAEGQRALLAFQWPDDRAFRVRMGIHTSEAAMAGGDYVGIGVHRAARICAAGHGGQVLLSNTTRGLLEEEPGFAVLDLGEHHLKDLAEPQRLFQLAQASLPRKFPPLRTLERRASNLPSQPTALVGRDRELASLRELLRREDVRLVTLTGPGGTGKSRLALQAAAELAAGFRNGVVFVPLAAIVDPELVLPTVAHTWGINEAAGQSLRAYLAPKELLLVLDNLEQVIAVAPRLGQLLSEAPRLKLLGTSREPLRIAGEHVIPVPPLSLPDLDRLPETSALTRFGAIALFVERARAARPEFALTPRNAAAVAELCVRLDGLPLALELAAARIAMLSPDAMLSRMNARLNLLTRGTRDLPERQQTLRNTLAWSHDLLEPEERRLFARLGVFAGGFTLYGAEAVCDAELDTLESLVDKSLVRRDGERYWMLETIREFAIECLASGGDEEAVRARHAAHFEALAEAAYTQRFRHDKEELDRVEREHDNLRAALDWLRRTDAPRCLRLAGALGWFWHVRSHFAEGRERLADALAAASRRDEVRARALAAAGELAAWAGDLDAARPAIREAIAIWQEHGRTDEVSLALHELGWAHFNAGDDEGARRCMEESLALQRSVGDDFLVNRARIGLLQVLVSLGEIDTVEPLAREALEVAKQLRDLRGEHFAEHFLADCALMRGDCATAEPLYQRALELAAELGDRAETLAEMQGVAMASAGLSRARRALRLAGAAQAEMDSLAIDLTGIRFWSELLDRYLGSARAQLGPDAAEAAWNEGRQLGFEQAVEEALSPARA